MGFPIDFTGIFPSNNSLQLRSGDVGIAGGLQVLEPAMLGGKTGKGKILREQLGFFPSKHPVKYGGLSP